MMGVQEVTALIGSLGFPIFCSIALFSQMNKMNKENREEKEAMHKANAEKNDKMTEAINNNTIAITKLVTMIGGEKVVH